MRVERKYCRKADKGEEMNGRRKGMMERTNVRKNKESREIWNG